MLLFTSLPALLSPLQSMNLFVLFLCANICTFERPLFFLQFSLTFMYKILAATPMVLDYIKILHCCPAALRFVFAQYVPYTLVKPLHPLAKGHFHLVLGFSVYELSS